MSHTRWSGLRRLMAAALLLAGSAPTALELLSHSADDVAAVHVEAADTRHHGDDCIINAVASSRVLHALAVPVVVGLPQPRQVVTPVAVTAVPRIAVRAATSRSPPRT